MKINSLKIEKFSGGGETVHRKYCRFFKYFKGGIGDELY